MRAGLVLMCFGMLVAPVGAYAQTTLPPGPGADVVARVCSGCHDLDQATSDHHDVNGWTDVFNTMAGYGATATDAEQQQIITYLAAHFGPAGAAPAAAAPAAGAPATSAAPAPAAPPPAQ